MFELLDASECPHVIRSLFRRVDITFLEWMGNGTLYDWLSINKPWPILQWMLQPSCTAACLEALGYAHGNINPQKMLLNVHDEVKLIDFDHSPGVVGDALDVGYEPHVRQHREVIDGIYGNAGSVTEQFALGSVTEQFALGSVTEQFVLGSIIWYITRGSELYSYLEGPDKIDRLLDGVVPTTDPQDAVDEIIRHCWNGTTVALQILSTISKACRDWEHKCNQSVLQMGM
ncbi:hypothetical protein DCS_08196 [Drechmeria coniospora]|uniref:Protein kinase domain-containing protein n=1 Tax=Drechmeria coniospora TaxID=98403 RepID=A0A151GGJ4_DRECN|nr:hypothetical protein DCS_08196 [Drechmeria coniospora]KYK56227.1 hypothetical protein DCS_08196 [Drechmeria coniospora]